MCKNDFLARYSHLIRLLSYTTIVLLLSSCGGNGGSGDSGETMEFVVTVPMNTPAEDIIFLQAGGAASASFKMKKIDTRKWGVNISKQMITDKDAAFNFGTRELSYAYTRGVDLMYFAGAEFFSDDPDNSNFNLKRKAVFSEGATQNDTVERWRFSQEDGQFLPTLPAELTTVVPRVSNMEFQAGIQINDFWTAPWADGGSGFNLIDQTSKAIQNAHATWVEVTPNWDYEQILPTPIIHADIRPNAASHSNNHPDGSTGVPSYDDASLRAHVQNLKSNGFKVILRTSVCCNGPFPGDIAGVGNAWWDEWFAQIENFILYHANLAEEEGVEAITIALLCCDASLFTNAPADRIQRWESMQTNWKAAFSGMVGYELISFQPCCTYFPAGPYFTGGIGDISHVFDFIGISIFDGIALDAMASQATLDSNAELLFTNTIDPINTASGLPIIIPSLSFGSYDGGAVSDEGVDTIGLAQFLQESLSIWQYDGLEQAMVFQAIMKAVANRPHVIGVYPFGYNWVATPLTPDYSIRGKPAEGLLAEWYDHFDASL